MKPRYFIASAVCAAVLGLAAGLAWVALRAPLWDGFAPAILWLLFVVVMFLPVIFLVAANPGQYKPVFFPRGEPELSEAEILQRNERKEKVIARIRESFRGVTLGNGVGLREGDELEYGPADRTMLKTIRDKDEKDNWERISTEDLKDYWDGLCFMDAEGMRFHLPAYLIADLQGSLNRDIDFFLTGLDDHKKSRLGALSKEQREGVREYLLYMRDTSWNDDASRAEIEKAIADFWAGGEGGPQA